MNICSNCGKEVSEGVAHCGHCGHRQQETAQKRTMMGIGAIDPEWQQKLIAARAAAKEKEEAAKAQEVDALEQTAAMEPVSSPASGDAFDDADLGTAPTEMMDTLDRSQLPGFSGESAPAAVSSGAEAMEDTQPQEPVFMGQDDTQPQEPVPIAQADPFSSEGAGESESADPGPSWQMGELNAQTEAEPGASSSGQVNLQGPMAGGGELAGSDDMGEFEAAAGGNKKRTILIVVIVGVLLSCCVASVAGYFIMDAFGDAAESLMEEFEEELAEGLEESE